MTEIPEEFRLGVKIDKNSKDQRAFSFRQSMSIVVYLWIVKYAMEITKEGERISWLQQKTCDLVDKSCSDKWCGQVRKPDKVLDNYKIFSYKSSKLKFHPYADVYQQTKTSNGFFVTKGVEVTYKMMKMAIVLLHFFGTLIVEGPKLEEVKKAQEYSLPSLDFLFKYNVPFSSEVQIYPFSLKKYFTEVERNNRQTSANRLMNYEWARYESFKTFPDDCVASPLRLAQSGFYYTGNGAEAVCYKCELKNADWSDEETVADTHKRLSPNCKFIKGEDADNVAIHGIETHNEDNTNGASGGPEDIATPNRNAGEQHRTSPNGNCDHSSQQQYLEQQSSPTTERLNDRATTVESSLQTNSNTGQRLDYNPTGEIERFPGITHMRPRHPEYAIKSVRLSSFEHWPFTDTLIPEDLADAGFFFVGIQDCVRCFFCGGGMKNWEYGDSPWIEHARWFPECAYLQQCKGEDFVNMCRLSHTGVQLQGNYDLNTQQTNVIEEQLIRDLNSIAAKRIIDMGFTQQDVENAIKHARQQLGSTEELKTQHLLQYLLDNNYTRNTATAAAAAANTVSTSTPDRHQTVLSSTNPPLVASNNIVIPRERSSSATTSGNTSPERRSTSKEDVSERKMLKEENRQLKERMMCKVCMDKDANIVFLPCGHLVSCVECAHALRKCAVCRTVIQGTVRAYAA